MLMCPRTMSIITLASMDESKIPTMDLLRCLGFQPDSGVLSDPGPGLSFDFGNFKLTASKCLNLRCVEVVLCLGVMSTPRTLGLMHFEMPTKMDSIKQCAAWIVWNLDQHNNHSLFRPGRDVGWIAEGRENQRLLPWILSMAEYEARPRCSVKRDWLRLAPKTLAENLADLPDDAVVAFSFDGSVLSIRCGGKVIALPGEGPPWTVRIQVIAHKLHRLPKRLISERLEVSIWESRIKVDSWSYAGIVEQSGSAVPSGIQ